MKRLAADGTRRGWNSPTANPTGDNRGAEMPGVPGVPAYAGPGVTARALRGSNRITCGASVKLWSIEGVAEDFGVEPDAARSLLETLGLPLLHLPGTDKRYVNLYGLESALFAMTLPEGLSMGEATASGVDQALVRLHQELAGVMYLASTREAVRERVKRIAYKMTGRLTRKPRRPIIEEQT